jgi:hypothetical protein
MLGIPRLLALPRAPLGEWHVKNARRTDTAVISLQSLVIWPSSFDPDFDGLCGRNHLICRRAINILGKRTRWTAAIRFPTTPFTWLTGRQLHGGGVCWKLALPLVTCTIPIWVGFSDVPIAHLHHHRVPGRAPGPIVRRLVHSQTHHRHQRLAAKGAHRITAALHVLPPQRGAQDVASVESRTPRLVMQPAAGRGAARERHGAAGRCRVRPWHAEFCCGNVGCTWLHACMYVCHCCLNLLLDQKSAKRHPIDLELARVRIL